MLIRLDVIQEDPVRWNEVIEVDPAVVEAPDLIEIGPVTWKGEVAFADPDYFLSASYEYEQSLACVRCLASVANSVRGKIQLLLTTENAPQDGGEVALKESELGHVLIRGEEIELNDFLEEQLALNIPMKPQCRRDCQGLCSQCGADLNEGSCNCEKQTVDPRWQALAGIKERLDEGR